MSDEWRSISTAPLDGTPVMARWGADDLYPHPLRWGAVLFGPDDHGRRVSCWFDLDDEVFGSAVGGVDPTEWRPLTAEELTALAGEIEASGADGVIVVCSCQTCGQEWHAWLDAGKSFASVSSVCVSCGGSEVFSWS